MKQSQRWLFIAILVQLGLFTSIGASASPSAEAPARNSAFVLIDSGPDFVRLLYRNPSAKQYVRIDSSAYVGIPVGASYEIDFLSWEYRPYTTKNDSSELFRSDALSGDDRAVFKQNLNGGVTVRRSEFQELDVLKVKINSYSKIAGPDKENYTLTALEFDVRWKEGDAPKASAVSDLDAGFKRMFNNLCINGEQIDSLRRKRVISETEKTKGFYPEMVGYKSEGALINLAKSPIANRQDAVRVRVRETGMLSLRASDFLKQGVIPDRVKLDRVRLWHRGVEIPVAIDKSGGDVFGEGDAIHFFGKESDSEYTVDSQYFLTWNEMETPPKRIETHKLEWSEEGAASFLSNDPYDRDRVLVEEKSNQQYGWYYLEIDECSKVVDYHLPDIVEEGDVSVTFKAFNKSRVNKGFTVRVGDATAHFSSTSRINTATEYTFTAPAKVFIQSSTIEITLDEDPEPYNPLNEGLSAKVGNVPHLFFDAIEFLYPRRAVAGENGLVVEREYLKPQTSSIALSATGGASSISAWVIDATGDVVRFRADSAPQGKAVSLPDGDWRRMEIHFDASLPGPYTIDRDFESSLHRTDQGYNYIIVAPRFMTSKASVLARRRAADGFSVLLVDVQDVYDEFNYGYPDCQALRDFFRYAQSEWTGLSPEFVLLIGDSSWDHRDRQGTGAVDLLPTYAPVNNPMEDASDEWYAYLWGGANDHFSDLIMGRLSVQNVEDLDKYLTKVDVYENSKVGPWRARSAYITDDDDGTFKRFAISNSEKSLPDPYHPYFIHQEEFPLVTNPYLYHRFVNNEEPESDKYLNKKYCPECVQAILDEFNRGPVLLQYIGHGGNQLWSEERIFYGTDKPTSNLLELEPTTHFPFVVSWSCLTGYMNFNISPWTVCLSEELIRYPDRGAIAVWGPSGSGTTNKHMSLSKYMLRNLTLDGLDRLGEALTLTKIEFMQEENNADLVNQYILFGDPAVRLSLPQERTPTLVTPGYFLSDREQEFVIQAESANVSSGKAVVSMTVAGENVYESQPFDFSGGKIQHQFKVALEGIDEPTAVVRFYAWNESDNKDSWGGFSIPQKKTTLELGNETVARNGEELIVRFDAMNPSPFDLKDVRCEIRIEDRLETVVAAAIPANSSATLVWKGTVPSSTSCAYVSVPADPVQGIEKTADLKPLIVYLRGPEQNPIVPLMGIANFSARGLVEGRDMRLQVPVRNFSEDREAYASMALNGPGAATEVKDVTLAAGRERRLDFSLTLPEKGEHEYVLTENNSDGERSFAYPVTVEGKPDLALAEGDFSFEPVRPVIGKTVTLKTTVYNMGYGPATDVVVKAFDGDPSLKRELRAYNSHRSAVVDRLEPGDMKEVSIVWDPTSYEGLGTHEIHFVVDPQNRIEELSEDNNRSSAALTMNDLPDLSVDRWNGHGFLTEIKNGMPVWGQSIKLLGRLNNVGDSDAEYVRFTFIHNRDEINRFYKIIPKGVVRETYVDVPLYAHKNTLRICADQFDLVGEKNETIELGNNLSEERRLDFQLTMPLAPIVNDRRIYRVTDEATFSAGDGEYLIYDEKHQELILHPDLENIHYRIVPAFVENQNAFSQNFPNNQWQWNTKYTCFYSPTNQDVPLRLNLPAPNGIYDVYMHLFSAAYVKGASARIRIKTPQDANPHVIEHGESSDENYMRKIGEAYHVRDDKFLVELRPVTGGVSTSLGDIQFVRVDNDLPVSGGYLSPYFPADGAGEKPATLSWNAEIPQGTELQFKARWVLRKDGNFRFMPWARTVDGQEGRLELPGRGDYVQYYVNFVRFTHGAETPKLRNVTLTVPCKEESNQ